MIAWFRRHYGATPLHLLGHLAAFAVCIYALTKLLKGNFVEYFIGGALLHDLVFLPLYSLLDRVARGGERPVRYANYLRIPAVMSGVMLVVYFPLIFGSERVNYVHDTGRQPPEFLGRWLLITAVLFLISAFSYAVALRRAR
ncbi:MAG: hypothetical protein J2O48_05515 [Solirubrobacterales bacterium]|nr:hypothetical protein [Solirubrobacterales bacterium]